MSHITEQAQRAIRAMKAAGFARKEFRVWTDKVYEGRFNGIRCYHYGEAYVLTTCANERVVERTPALVAQGFTVHEWTATGFRTVHPTAYGKTPQFHSYAEKQAALAEWEAYVARYAEQDAQALAEQGR